MPGLHLTSWKSPLKQDSKMKTQTQKQTLRSVFVLIKLPRVQV